MDVWFDSGVSHQVMQDFVGLKQPFEYFLEGQDQYRGWFNSSLIISSIMDNKAPYKNVVTHGFTNDQKGRKMSKSLGNTIDPLKIIKQYGADVLRLWVSSVNYENDVRLGDEILKQTSDSYRKIRNTFKFMLSNISDFNLKNAIADSDLADVDKYMLVKTEKFQNSVKKHFDALDFSSVYTTIINFITTDLSKFYLDFIKDILYIENNDSHRRLSVQTTLIKIIKVLIFVLKPILPHTVYDISKHLDFDVWTNNDLTLKTNFKNFNIGLWDKFMQFRSDFLKEAELMREDKLINKTMECELFVEFNKEFEDLVKIDDMYQILILSGVKHVKNNDGRSYKSANIKVMPKNGDKCQRCWIITSDIVKDKELCQRCYKIISK